MPRSVELDGSKFFILLWTGEEFFHIRFSFPSSTWLVTRFSYQSGDTMLFAPDRKKPL